MFQMHRAPVPVLIDFCVSSEIQELTGLISGSQGPAERSKFPTGCYCSHVANALDKVLIKDRGGQIKYQAVKDLKIETN
jgi:hypothetical protein